MNILFRITLCYGLCIGFNPIIHGADTLSSIDIPVCTQKIEVLTDGIPVNLPVPDSKKSVFFRPPFQGFSFANDQALIIETLLPTSKHDRHAIFCQQQLYLSQDGKTLQIHRFCIQAPKNKAITPVKLTYTSEIPYIFNLGDKIIKFHLQQKLKNYFNPNSPPFSFHITDSMGNNYFAPVWSWFKL